MTIINKQQDARREVHKAAELCADYQDAWQHWLLGKTVEKAFTVIAKGERLLVTQNETGLKMQDPTAVRLRINVCKQYLEDTPEPSDKPPAGRVMTEEEAIKRVGKQIAAKLSKRKLS